MNLKILMSFLITFIICGPKRVHASYIDPNTGGMLFQVLAVLLGILSTLILIFSSKIKGMFYRARRFIRRSNSGAEPVEQDEVERNLSQE